MDETFFAAQRRHRLTARLYSALAAFAAVLQGVPMAVIISPVAVGVAVLVTDVVNLWYPVADLTPAIGRLLESLSAPAETTAGTTSPGTTPATSADDLDPAAFWTGLLLLALPGLAAMVALWWLVRRFLLRDGLGGVLVTAGARPADRSDAEEHQLVNVVEEISLAAGIAPPRVLVLPADVPNAAAFGRSPESWTIAVSRGLLDDLDRDATQGVIAHLVGSVANGDLRMQHSLLSLFVSHQLAQDLISAPFAPSCRRRVGRVWRMLRGKAGPEDEAETIGELLAWDESENFVVSVNMLTFKLVQFYTTVFVVGGILTLPFRARRYLADATAVQLARTPDGIGRALRHLQDHRRPLPGAEFAAIYTITAADLKVGDGSVEDVATLPASLQPPLHKRLDRLHRLGFRGRLPRRREPRSRGRGENWPAPLRWLVTGLAFAVLAVIGVPLLVLLALTVTAGVILSVALGFLFWALVTGVIVLPLHALLRGLG
jgi:Zn-dependent protease with chaperone function